MNEVKESEVKEEVYCPCCGHPHCEDEEECWQLAASRSPDDFEVYDDNN